MFSLRPVTARMASRVRQPRPLDWSGFPTIEIHPAEVLDQVPALALPDDYDRITGAIDEIDVAAWIAEARGGPSPQEPTLAYDLGPALIADGTVYYGGGYEVLQGGLAKAVIRGTPERFGEAQLCVTSLTERFFGHWLVDTPAMMVLAEQRGLTALGAATSATAGQHRTAYTGMIGLPLAEPRLATVEKLWFVDDRPRNRSRGARLAEFRRRVRRHAPADGPRRVVIDRALSGVRRYLANGPALWDMLVRDHGFEVIDPMGMPAEALIAKLAAAEIVIGVEGSNLFHAIAACPDGALIVAIMPPARFSTAMKWYTDILDLDFGFTVADPAGEDFVLPVERMRRLMAMIEAR